MRQTFERERRSFRSRPVSSALFIACLAIGCGGSGEGTAPESSPASSAPATASGEASSDACTLLTPDEIAKSVGNPVQTGQPFAGPEVCKWDTASPDDVSVLLTVRLAGSIRGKVLCEELRKAATAGTEGRAVAGLGDVATFKFSRAGTLFNSGDLEACGAKGFVGLSLNGQKDEAALEQATVTLARAVLGRM